jgi:transposase
MAGFFRAPDRRQRYLLPVDMMDWVPSRDIVDWVVDAVELMDLSAFEAEHRVVGSGQAPFAPRVLLAVLIYAYSQGVLDLSRFGAAPLIA